MDVSLVSDTTPAAIAALSTLICLEDLRLDALFLPDHPGKELEACLVQVRANYSKKLSALGTAVKYVSPCLSKV